MDTFRQLSGWAQERFERALGKKIGDLLQILAADSDSEEIRLQLRKGSLELKNFSPSLKNLNERFSNDLYEVESVLIGRLNVNPFTLRIVAEGVSVVVKQREGALTGHTISHFDRVNPGFSASQPLFDEFKALEAAESGVNEGITLVSRIVQWLLKTLHVEGKDIVVQVKLASRQSLTIQLDNITVKNTQESEIELNTAYDLAKACSFSGLAVKLSDPAANEVLSSLSWRTTGCSATIAVGWSVDELENRTIELKAVFNGACVWMSPAAVPVISKLVEAFSSLRPHEAHYPTANMPDHSLSRSMMVADATFSSNVSKALKLPDGEPLLRDELAHTTGEDIDEFFDAQSSIVLDYMSQSFFSTASTVFSEASTRPSSANDESFAPVEDSSRQSAANEVPVKVDLQVQVEVAALEVWLACRSQLIGSEDPWYMRLTMQGLLLKQLPELSTNLSSKSFTISEYTPIEANRSKLHDVGQFEAMYKKFVGHCGLSCSMPLPEEEAFAETLRRLEQLKLAGRDFWCLPDNYEMSPVVACAAADLDALSLVVEKSGAPSCPLSARLLLLEVQSWLNAPMLARIQELLSSFAAGSPTTSEEQQAVSLDLSVHMSSLTLCCFATNAAVVLRVLSGIAIDEMFSDFFHEPGTRRKRAVCPTFVDFQRRLDETTCQVSANRAQLYNMCIEDTEGSIDIVDGGNVHAFSISCMLNVCVDFQKLAEDWPSNIAELIDQRKLTVFVGSKASDITIAGDIRVSASPTLVRSVTEIARSFSVYSRPPTNSGVFKIHIANLKLKFLGPLFLNCSGIHLLHILGDNMSSLAIGSLGSVHLDGSSEWPYISTSNSEKKAVVFAISDRSSSARQAPVRRRLVLHMAGIIFAEDFLREKPIWSAFNYINVATQSPSDPTGPSLALDVSGKELLIIQIPSSEYLPIAAVYLPEFCVVTSESAEVFATIHGGSIYLRESGLAYSSTQSSLSVPSWMQETGFFLIACEDQLELKRCFSSISMIQSDSISLQTHSLHIYINKDSAALVKKLPELPLRRNPSEEACQAVPEMDAIGEALDLDIRGNKQPDALLNGGWYDQGVNIEDSDLRKLYLPTEEAIIDGDGAWASSYPCVHIQDWVHYAAEIGMRRSLVPARVITIAMGAVTLAIVGTANARDGDILEGSLQLEVGRTKASWKHYDRMDILHDCTCSIQRLSLRHNIHPQATTTSSPWRDVLVCPHLRGQSNAFKYQMETFKSQSGCDELVLDCEPGSALVQLDQYLLIFLLSFAQEIKEIIDPIDSDWQTIEKGTVREEQSKRSEEVQISAESDKLNLYIRRCHIAGFALTASYIPVYIDIGALRKGSYVELVNTLRKWKAFNIWLRELEICGVESISSLSTDAAARWKHEILDFQLDKFSISLPLGASVPVGTIGKKMTDFASQPATPSKETLEQLQKEFLALWPRVVGKGRRVGATVAKAWEHRR